MGYVTAAWVFGAAWMYVTSVGAAPTRYGRVLGMTDFQFGLLAALLSASAALQLPASYFVERYGFRKSVLLIAGIIHRTVWLVIALVPWVLPQAWWWSGLMLLMTVSASFSNVSTPGVLSWFADLIPERVRGRYFSRRAQIGQLVGLAMTLVVGEVLDLAAPFGDAMLRRTISLLFAAAALCGIADFLTLTKVPDTKHRADPTLSLRELLVKPWRDGNFRWFAGFSATLNFGLIYVGQYIWLYVFDEVKMNNREANLLLMTVPILLGLAAYPLWGKIVDRWGCKATLLVSGALIVHGAAAWIFVTKESWWMGYSAAMVAMAAWPGVDLASFTLLLRMGGSGDGRRQGSAYIAANSIVVAAAGLLSGLFGGTVAKLLEGWRGSLLGWPLTYHGVLFLISCGLRLLSLVWLFGLHEPEAGPTFRAVRYIVGALYSNMQHAVYMPVRRLLRLGRWAYVLSRWRLLRPLLRLFR
ncbi:MAG: MFS transporter [Planctomycetes bacterium]|nr:MFS transporter [Planctomycetota bacterium]